MNATIQLVGFGEIGAYLRDAREAAQLPLDRPARDLHLRAAYLEAMENGHPEELPGAAYARGYAKKYAEYLGVDVDFIMRAFDQALHFRDAAEEPRPTRREARPHRLLLTLCAVALLLLMGAWRVLWPEGAKPADEGSLLAAAAPANLARPQAFARNCWSYLPVEPHGPACFSAPAPKHLRPRPTMRYGTELELPVGASHE